MSSEREVLTPERVARVFEDAGYEVSQVVGEKPGTVDFFATKRTGFERSKTYFEVWGSCPEAGELDEAIARLEERRKERKADRALGVVPTGSLPAGYVSVWEGRTAEVVTWKRLVLELSGFVDLVRRQVAEYASKNEDRYYFPRHLKLKTGEEKDALECILSWVQTRPSAAFDISVELDDRGRHEFRSLFAKARYESAKIWLRNPEQSSLLCDIKTHENVPRQLIDADFLVPVDNRGKIWSGPALFVDRWVDKYEGEIELEGRLRHEPSKLESWFLSQMATEGVRRRFVDARMSESGFCKLSDASVNARSLLRVFDSEAPELERLEGAEWIAWVVHSYMSAILGSVTEPPWKIELWADAALEQFGLKAPPHRFNDELYHLTLGLEVEESWLDVHGDQQSFDNELILHYFVARKIASELELLTRYQFPREYVLLFLALISPEAASVAVADRSDAIRKEIEDEVERRLQLTIGHQVRRSAGAIRAQFNVIKRRFRPEDLQAFEYEIGRIDQEIDFLRALAEQTRRWHEVPEAAITAVPIEGVVRSSVERIALQYPAIAHVIDVDTSLRIRASADVFREVIESLVENAFQAVAFGAAIATPRIAVRARLEGETVRIDVVDNGPGIPARDRERIFDLYVTTKKGGDKPLGTGMGLPIARKYAQHVGGMVALDPDQTGGTCFFARFVVWKETS